MSKRLLTPDNLSAYIDLQRRTEILSMVVGTDANGELPDLQALRKGPGSVPAVTPHIPQVLWPHIRLYVEQRNEETGEIEEVEVPTNAMTLSVHGAEARPNLLDVNYVDLRDDEAQVYSGFSLAYASYLEELKNRIEDRMAQQRFMRDQLLAHLKLAYYPHVSARTRDMLAKSDPYVAELERALSLQSRHAARLGSIINALNERVKQISRDLTRRVSNLHVQNIGGHGTGVSRGPMPGPVSGGIPVSRPFAAGSPRGRR